MRGENLKPNLNIPNRRSSNYNYTPNDKTNYLEGVAIGNGFGTLTLDSPVLGNITTRNYSLLGSSSTGNINTGTFTCSSPTINDSNAYSSFIGGYSNIAMSAKDILKNKMPLN